jgi:hypothetical protein
MRVKLIEESAVIDQGERLNLAVSQFKQGSQ